MPHRGRHGNDGINRSPLHNRADAAGHQSLLDQLETAFASRDIGARVGILQRVTDLFVAGAKRFDVEQVALFDDVMCRLIDEIDHTACAAFGLPFVRTVDPGDWEGEAFTGDGPAINSANEEISLDGLGVTEADDPMLVFNLTDQVRETI